MPGKHSTPELLCPQPLCDLVSSLNMGFPMHKLSGRIHTVQESGSTDGSCRGSLPSSILLHAGIVSFVTVQI